MKRPAFQFYPADWRKDVELRSCSIAARGLWIDLLCLAHECDPYGHLLVNGRPMTAAQMAGQVGLPAAQCVKLLQELIDNGVARKTPEGVVYSKRMVEDEDLRQRRAEGGKAGSEHGAKGAEHGVKGGRPTTPRGVSEPPSKPPSAAPLEPPPSSSSSSSTSLEIQEATPLVDKPAASRPPPCPSQALVDLYHEHLPMLPRVDVLNASRLRALSARWRDTVTDPDIRKAPDVRAAGLDWWAWFFGYVAQSNFLTGRAKAWRADFDFLLNPTKWAKVVEGHYHKDQVHS